MQKHGQIENFITDNTLSQLKKIFVASQPSITSKSKLHCLFPEHANFKIMKKILMPDLVKHFGNDVKIGSCNHTIASDSYGLHFDNYQVLKFGEPYFSILFPISGFDTFSTFIFDVESDNIDPTDVENRIMTLEIKNKIADPDLAHVDDKLLSRISIKGKHYWKKNSAIYWQTNLLHCSSKHPKTIAEKEFIIIHTYL